MKITEDTSNDSKEEIIRAIKLLQEAVSGSNNQVFDAYESEKPKQDNEFSLGALNFNDEPKVEAVDLDTIENKESDGPTQEEVEALIMEQTKKAAFDTTNQPSQPSNSQSSNTPPPSNNQSSNTPPANAFGAMFGGENKDVFSNDSESDDNNDIFSELTGNIKNEEQKKDSKDDDWGPRKRMMLADLDRY